MKIIKYLLIFTLISIGLSILVYVVSGGHAMFLLGGIPLVFGGYWTFGNRDKSTE